MRYNYNDIDLHIHTNDSDGKCTSEQIVKKAYDEGLKLISITDHNYFTNNYETKKLAEEHSIILIPGIEFSVQFEKKFFHLLAYFNEKNVNKLKHLFSMYNRIKYKKLVEFMKKLKDENILLTTENVNKFGRLSFKNIARAMVQEGYVNSFDAAMDKYIDNKQFFNCKVGLPITDVIETIHDMGGVVSLAHPFHSFSDEVTIKNMINQLVSMGVDGIECYNGKQTSDKTSILRELASQHNLIETGGSDFHGSTEDGGLGIKQYISIDKDNAFWENFI